MNKEIGSAVQEIGFLLFSLVQINFSLFKDKV